MTPKLVARSLLATLALALCIPVTAGAAEYVPIVAGEDWKKSAPILKRAYLIGVSNLMSLEYAYQKEMGPPPDRETTIQRLFEEIDDETLDGCIARIDAWYKANPDKLGTSVLEVIWLDMVRPNLPASRRYE